MACQYNRKTVCGMCTKTTAVIHVKRMAKCNVTIITTMFDDEGLNKFSARFLFRMTNSTKK